MTREAFHMFAQSPGNIALHNARCDVHYATAALFLAYRPTARVSIDSDALTLTALIKQERTASDERRLLHDGTLTWIGNSALGHQLRQQDAERPHVRLDGELPVQSRLWSRPFYWELRT